MLNLYFSLRQGSKTQIKTYHFLNKHYIHITLLKFLPKMLNVNDVLLHLNVSKASGPDLINPCLLKEGADILAYPFSIVFNRSPDQVYFPHSWKEANVSPISENDNKSLPSNYRQIALLCQAEKVMKRCIHKHLYIYLLINHVLTPLHQVLSLVTQLLFSCSIHIICSKKRSTMVKKS